MSARRKGAVIEGVPRVMWNAYEFAAATGTNYETVLREIRRGTLAAIKLGGEYRIPDAELQRVIAEAMEKAAAVRAAAAKTVA